MPAGKLREKIAFDKRPDESADSPPGDGFGNVQGGWAEQFVLPAQVSPMSGRNAEIVAAAHVEGLSYYTIVVRFNSKSNLIKGGWRARDTRSDRIWNIDDAVNYDEKKQFMEMRCVLGGAQG